MNIETLRREYDKLTPFEREAMLIHESVGRRRKTEADALESRDLVEFLQMTLWGANFFMVAALGMFRAIWAERTAWMYLAHAGKERDVKGAGQCFHAAVGWLRALKRLEEETGAPFSDAGKMIDPDYGGNLLETFKDEAIDDSRQYAALREIWDVCCSNVNTEDQWRLPPCPAGTESERRAVVFINHP